MESIFEYFHGLITIHLLLPFRDPSLGADPVEKHQRKTDFACLGDRGFDLIPMGSEGLQVEGTPPGAVACLVEMPFEAGFP